jgi:hypothetical protein
MQLLYVWLLLGTFQSISGRVVEKLQDQGTQLHHLWLLLGIFQATSGRVVKKL